MSSEDELLRIAVDLVKCASHFRSGWNINFLQSFIRDEGRCVYCGRDVMPELCVPCGDHLLPKHRYPTLAQSVDNLVPACTLCNRIKSHYDPSEGLGMQLKLTETVRKELIDKARKEITRRRDEYAAEFKSCEPAFREAIFHYQKYRSQASDSAIR
jgi:5-methylcytosine-specific restriction endonuclease McrA